MCVRMLAHVCEDACSRVYLCTCVHVFRPVYSTCQSPVTDPVILATMHTSHRPSHPDHHAHQSPSHPGRHTHQSHTQSPGPPHTPVKDPVTRATVHTSHRPSHHTPYTPVTDPVTHHLRLCCWLSHALQKAHCSTFLHLCQVDTCTCTHGTRHLTLDKLYVHVHVHVCRQVYDNNCQTMSCC